MKKSLRKRIRIRSPVLVALLVLLGILAGTIPAYAWSDSGLPIPKDTPVTVTGVKPWHDGKQWYYIGVWTIHISGAKNGTGQAAMGQTYKDPDKKLYGEGYCFIDDRKYEDAARDLNGEPSFVMSHISSEEALLNWGSSWQKRTYIHNFLKLCGAQFLRWEKGHIYVRATEKPNANLTLPSTIRTGQSAKIGISGSSFVPSDSPYRNISWVLKVNGSTVDSGQGTMSFNKQVSHTFTSANSTIRLEVTDGVGRTTVVERNASGQSPPTPPPPPTSGGSQGPVADFSMPRNAEIGEAVTITDMSYHPGGGTIIDRQWMIYPNDYTGYLSGTGGTLRFNSEGTYDVVLIVKDNNNRMDSAEKQIHIGPPPPPPPPPEPENDPPVARFTMPSVASPGETVNVVNESYDPDGYLTVIQWNVTPSSGVTNNLGDFGGTLIFDKTGTYEVELFVVDDFGDYDEYSREISIENQAPVAKILAPDKALQGEDIEIKSASYDPDGTIEKTTWSVAPDGMVGILTGEGNTVYFDQPGTYTITLTVEDNHGEASTATVQIEVLPAVPQAFFVDEGPYKQNRKLTLIEQGITSARYPIVKEQDEWQIVPAGGGATSEAIKINKVAPDKLEVLFRTAGIYKVSLRVTNSAGNQSEWYERTFNILEDKPPVADFSVAEFVTRDLANNKKATIMPRDTSYSPDGDIIVERIWKYRYDSNNDGSFEDEAWVVFSNTNEMTPSFETDQVGKYQIELEVTEGFGEETLAEYITPSDYLKGDTSEKPLNEKRAEVINMSPLVSFQAFQKHLVDVAIVGNAGAVWEFDFLDNSDGSADSIAQALEGQLKSANLDAKVSTYAITQPETQTTFPWVAYNLYGQGFGSGDGQFDISSNNYVYKGYGSEAPIDHVYYEDDSYERRYFNFDIDMTGYNACAVTIPGFIFGATDKSGFKGYIALMWHDQVGVYYFSGNDHTILTKNGAGQIASNRSPSSFGGIQIWVGPTVTTSLQKSFQFVYSPGTKELKVFNDGVLLDTISCPNAAGNGYGIAVANSSHNCGARSYVRFNNVSLVSGEATPLDEVVRSVSWRDNAHKFVFDMSMVDHQTQVLDSPGALGRLLSSLLTRDIDYSVTNLPFDETAARNIITMNDDNGAWFPLSGNMPQLIQDYGLYIITKILGLSSLTNYIILNEEVYYEAHYSDAEEDPKYSERWRYNHDPNYFENSLGRASYDGQWLPTPIYRFDKVGKFNITFQAQDNPKDDERFAEYRMWSSTTQDDLEIYVHRKPVASFQTAMRPAGQGSIVFTEGFESANSIFDFSGNWIRTNIKARTGSWSYRSAPIGNGQTSTSQFTVEVPAGATNAKLSFYYYVSSQMPSGCDYGYDELNIYLDGTRIVNASGEFGWVYVERSLSAGNHTVRFEYTKDSSGSAGSDAGFVDDITLSYLAPRFNVDINNISAYDLDHMSLPNKGIVEHRWSWKPPTGIAWTTGAGPPSLQIGQGQDYLLRYEVKDMEGAWSNPCVVYLTLEQQPPIAQFTITPNPVVVGSQVTINDTSYDPNGDPITERLWSTRHNGGPWSPHTSTPPTSFDKAGTWEVELVVKDHSLWSEPCVQTVTVLGNTRPVARFTVSPNPAYDYETLYYEDTSYDPDGDPIGAREWRVSKDGGAWQYYATPPTTLPAGNYVIELRVQDIPQHPMLEPLWSEWYRQTLTVKESFEIVGQVTPNPAERGRKIRITAYAQRIGTGEKIQISEVKAYIPHPTKPDDTPALPGGTTPVVVNMSWDNAIKGYVYDYLLPDKTVDGRWTDDGTYYIRVVGKQGEVEKEALLPVQIRGHILQRVYIRTDKW